MTKKTTKTMKKHTNTVSTTITLLAKRQRKREFEALSKAVINTEAVAELIDSQHINP